VLELGPFLGGTTRALAHGMEHSDRRLITIDEFDNYYDAETFARRTGVRVESTSNSLPFRDIFEQFHRDEPYYKHVDAVSMKVADRPTESTDYSCLDTLEDLRTVFIDGCKSWYSVKDFVGHVAPRCDTGSSLFVFQDFGRYTCFWIPAFMEVFADSFRFVGSVDATYVFRLTSPLDINRFADDPQGMNVAEMEEMFDNLLTNECARNNHSGMVVTQIQKAAYLAFIGDKEKARLLLTKLLTRPYVVRNLRKRVREALVSLSTPRQRILDPHRRDRCLL
jgi:hypothetical protein